MTFVEAAKISATTGHVFRSEARGRKYVVNTGGKIMSVLRWNAEGTDEPARVVWCELDDLVATDWRF